MILRNLILKIFIFSSAFVAAFADNFPKYFIEERDIVLKESIKVIISFVQDFDLDRRDRIWMIDWNKSELFRFDSNGESSVLIAKKGKGPGELLMPQSIYIGQNDHVFVANFGNRVTEYDSDGKYVNAFVTTDGHIPTNCISVDNKGVIFIGGPRKKRYKGFLTGEMIHIYSPIGNYLRSFYQMDKNVGLLNLESYSAAFFDFDGNNNIYAVQSVNFLVTTFDESGNFVKSFGEREMHYKRPTPLTHEIERDKIKMEKFLKDFTYVMDIFVVDKKVAVLSRNYVGENDIRFKYFIDVYDCESGKLLAGGIESDMILYRTRRGKFYFLKTIRKDGKDQNIIKVYRLR